MSVGFSVKGQLNSQGSIAIELSANICVGSRGGIMVIAGRPEMKPHTDFRGRVDYISLVSNGQEVGNVEIDYMGELISAVRYNYGNKDTCYFYYENGKLSKVSGPKGNFKVRWDSFNDISGGDRIW